jgi:hypothetical protein
MNNTNLKIYVEELIESILNNKTELDDIRYEHICRIRDSLIDMFKIDLNKIDTTIVSDIIKSSEYHDLFKNIDIDQASNAIFLKRIDGEHVKNYLNDVIEKIDEKNYINKLYAYSEFYDKQYGLNLNNIETYFNKCKKHEKLEIVANFAVFLESYTKTKEGQQLVSDCKNGKKDIQELIFKMNDCSLTPLFDENPNKNKKFTYNSAKAGSLDGFFIVFDDDNNLTFNVSTTASPSVRIEGTSVFRHATTAKFISDAITEELDSYLYEMNMHNSKYSDDKESLKKDRAYIWNQHINTNSKSKMSFIANALIKKIESLDIFDIDDSLKDQNLLLSGESLQTLIKKLNGTNPCYLINKSNKTDKVIELNDMKKYFNESDFKSNFISVISDTKYKAEYATSDLKSKLDQLNLSLPEFKVYLQNATLKDMTYEEYKKEMDKESIDYFYDHVLTRRAFSSANQLKINNRVFPKLAERALIVNMLLSDDSIHRQNLKFISGIDLGNAKSYFGYLINQNKVDTTQDYINNNTYVAHIKEKIEFLDLNINYKDLLNKVYDRYDINYAQSLLALEMKQEENNSMREAYEKLLKEVSQKKQSEYLTEDPQSKRTNKNKP